MYLNINAKKQRGFLLPLSIFILVVMSMFALVLSRNTIQTTNSAVQEVITVQTFYAGESGAQRAMQNLFYPDASSRKAVDTRCLALSTTYTFTVTGLNNCSAIVNCTCLYQNNTSCSPATVANYSVTAPTNVLNSFYKISSIATCGSGIFQATRTIEVSSFLKQE